MLYTRIKSYHNGEFTSCEHLYLGTNQVKALERFRNEYPEHKECILVAQTYDSEAEENKEHFQACLRCGCVHWLEEVMKRRTYNNMLKATKLIANKGYEWNKANEIAMQIFDEAEKQKNGMSIEWYINKIANRNNKAD